MPCIVYLHGNAGNLMEGLAYSPLVLPMGITFCSFDFSGCGNSSGDYVTLGYRERDDLKAVIDFLKEFCRISTIGLWGRSMGATTAIMYMAQDPEFEISCVALDSGFSSLSLVFGTMTKRQGFKPEVLDALLPHIDKGIYDKVGFHIKDLNPEEFAKSCKAPALFLHGRDDVFIIPENTKRNFDAYAGPKDVEIFAGDHNSERSVKTINKILAFLEKHLLNPDSAKKPIALKSSSNHAEEQNPNSVHVQNI